MARLAETGNQEENKFWSNSKDDTFPGNIRQFDGIVGHPGGDVPKVRGCMRLDIKDGSGLTNAKEKLLLSFCL